MANTHDFVIKNGLQVNENSTVSADISLGDNNKLKFGASDDLQIYHDGSNSFIKDAGTGYLVIQANAIGFANAANNENLAFFTQDGAATLYYDNVARLATTSTGIDVTGTIEIDTLSIGGTTVSATPAELNLLDGATVTTTEINYNDITTLGTVQASKTVTANSSGNVIFPDSAKALFGSGSDLFITHDGTNTVIRNSVGTFYIDQDLNDGDIQIRSDNGSGSMTPYFMADGSTGSATLYHYGSGKIATTSTGVTVTGNIVVSGTVDGRDLATDGTKLDGIESGATADQTITAGSGLTGGGTGDVTLYHADTSSQASVDNSNGTVVQDITLDGYGHVTALGSVNLDGRYYTETEADSRFVNVTGDTMTGTLRVSSGADIELHTSGTDIGDLVWLDSSGEKHRLWDGGTGLNYRYRAGTSYLVFHDGYHPNADKWTTARTLSLSGDASGSVSWDGSANATLSVTVANDSHTHDGRYYTETEADSRFVNVTGDTMTGDLVTTSGNGNGIFIGSGGANITSVTPSTKDIVIQDVAQIRFGGASWDWNAWAGIAFNDSTEVLTIGGPASSVFSSNASPPDITINFDGLSGTNGLTYEGSTIWHAGNDGSGSGLDADTVDGIQGAFFLRSDTADTASGDITFSGGAGAITVSAGSDLRFTTGDWTGEHAGKIQYHANHFYFQGSSQWIFRTAAGANNAYIENNGRIQSVTDVRAPIFYDRNDTSYYADPAGNSRTNTEHTNYLGLGTAANTSGSYRLNMGGSIDMNANSIDYVNQLHFNDNVRFYDDGNDNYLNFKYGDTGAGGIRFYDGDTSQQGYVYADGGGTFGLLSADGTWAVQTTNAKTTIHHRLDTPIIYDSNNTTYFLDPSSSNSAKFRQYVNIGDSSSYSSNSGNWGARLNVVDNVHARIDVGQDANSMLSSWWAHTGNSGPIFGTTTAHPMRMMYNGTEVGWWNNDYLYHNSDIRSPIFYDSNDTGYYLNPNDYSSVWGIAIRGDYGSTDYRNQIFFWSSGGTTTSAIGFKANGGVFTNPTGNGDGYNTYLTMDTVGRGWVFRRGTGGTDFSAAYTSGWILNNGIWQANASMRAPIFYDSANTSYYVDPASGFYQYVGTSTGTFVTTAGSGGISVEGNNASGPKVGIKSTASGGEDLWLISNNSNNAGGAGKLQLWNNSGGFTFAVFGTANTSDTTYIYCNLTASGNVTAYSDERLKENVVVIPNALDKVKAIRGVTFNRNDMEEKPRHAGVIAQEVEKVLPEVVSEDNKGIKTVAYGNMVGLLIEAIKELKDEVDDLKAQLAAK